MRIKLPLHLVLLIALLFGTGCSWLLVKPGGWFFRRSYDRVLITMDRQEVEKIMGRPTQVEENVMIYKYDYPHRQVLLRFVLDEDDFLIEKHLETADELARKTPEQFEEDMPQPEEETEEGDYPGGPLPRFRDWRNRRLRN